jgi:protein-L-isoaspartate(D-aspartate) O-methyltransferase
LLSKRALEVLMGFEAQRAEMVRRQLAARGISDERLLAAFGAVPREEFVPEGLREFAYEDAALPIGGAQTISQPYVVAITIEALGLRGHERVLEIGAGSGYAAAVLSRLAKEVYTIERLELLADQARQRLARLGYENVRVLCADGTLGLPEHAPYDAIAVAAGGPELPKALLAQLAQGGRLVIPVGPEESSQVLTRVVAEGQGRFREDPIADVQFVPLIGEQGWPERERVVQGSTRANRSRALSTLLRETAEHVGAPDSAEVGGLIERIGQARLVLLGEATHGTSEFYRMRARITRELIERGGFDFVAVEADWPDAAKINAYVLGDVRPALEFSAFARFPTWMWRNQEVHDFVSWLRTHNLGRRERSLRVGFHGLDLYSMFTSIAAVLAYLEDVDPGAARVARARYGTLTPWQKNPAAYGEAVLVGRYRSSEAEVVAMLRDLLARRLEYSRRDGERFFDAAQNAHLVANAERYYRALYYGSATSWNLRDTHMWSTLQALLAFYGAGSRGIVWEHNSHVGNALATEMSARGELNLGQLARTAFGEDVYAVGFGTDHGTVAAASNWDEPVQRMAIRPAHPDSYERLFHDSEIPAFVLHLREPRRTEVRDELTVPRLERAIGVVYRPESELTSHYFQASLPYQFDEMIWFDETRAVEPLPALGQAALDLPETYPFGL